MSIAVAIVDNELQGILFRKGMIASCAFIEADCQEKEGCKHNIVLFDGLIVGALLSLDDFENTEQSAQTNLPQRHSHFQ